MAEHMSKCKVGIVAVDPTVDSCPRVIPEMLACGLPIIVLDGTRFWVDKYIEGVYNSRYPYASGELATKEHFWSTVKYVLDTPPGTYLKLLEGLIDPKKSLQVDRVVKVTFTDLNQSWSVHVRRGVAEVTERVPETVDATLALPREMWARIALKETTLEEAIASGKVTVKGNQEALTAVFGSFG